MRRQRISPAGFDLLQRSLLEAEADGLGPYECACQALNSVGLPHEPMKFIVDYSLDGPIYPFMEWPQGWKNDDGTKTPISPETKS